VKQMELPLESAQDTREKLMGDTVLEIARLKDLVRSQEETIAYFASQGADKYKTKALVTESTPEFVIGDNAKRKLSRIMHAAMGVVTESGELMDALKKHLMYGRALDYTNLVEEAGDIMWYIALLSDALGVPLSEIMNRNLDKLAKRYPTKFSCERALNRDLAAERAALEAKASDGGQGTNGQGA